MTVVCGVKFQTPGKVYYFDPCDFYITEKDHVIVETARGVEYGDVVFSRREVADSDIKQPLKEIIRVATKADDEKYLDNKQKEEEAYSICKKKIAEHGLDMKLVSSEYTFDRGKLLFYFTADGRIDFRELVKDLASVFRTRIELRQVGVRDETKLIGGIGSCGRPLCCHTYLREFAPVSIRMAKEQNLSLNQTKISGTCGRLMCCLKNEQETYEYLNKDLPNKGKEVTTPEGLKGTVQSVNVLRRMVNVVVCLDNDEKELRTYHIEELNGRKRPEKNKKDEMDEIAAFFDQYIGADRDVESGAKQDEEDAGEMSVREEAGGEDGDAEEGEKKPRRRRRRRRRNRKRSGKENAGNNTEG